MPIPFTENHETIDAAEYNLTSDYRSFAPEENPGISKYRSHLGCGATLDALFVNQQSDTLIVSCHGALPRKTTVLPRFERLRTLLNTKYSSLYFGDPTLHLSEQVGLAWYTGWKELDLYPVLAEWVNKAAEVSGADKIVFLGSSGGGFASMQVSSFIPGSMAVPLNPQTAIWKYQPKGSLGYARNYIKNIMPHLTPDGGVRNVTAEVNWSEPLGERASTLIRYARPIKNYVYYTQNYNDISHWNDHYLPFRESIKNGPNVQRVRFFTYAGQHTHTSPKSDVFAQIMDESLAWLTDQHTTVGNQ